jgi:hypothetical protein
MSRMRWGRYDLKERRCVSGEGERITAVWEAALKNILANQVPSLDRLHLILSSVRGLVGCFLECCKCQLI